MLIGEEHAVSELWPAARPRMRPPRDDRPGQPVFALTQPPPPGDTGLRAATPDDVDRLLPACIAAHEEELGADPLAPDSEFFRRRTEEQVDAGRSWLWLEDGTIRFKAEASAWTPSAVQLQQVWVDPEARGRGDGKRGLADLCRLLLAQVPAVCLFVRRENLAAIRLYETVGMSRRLTYRSLLF
jgi:predicted GNAT family acetyltransferase